MASLSRFKEVLACFSWLWISNQFFFFFTTWLSLEQHFLHGKYFFDSMTCSDTQLINSLATCTYWPRRYTHWGAGTCRSFPRGLVLARTSTEFSPDLVIDSILPVAPSSAALLALLGLGQTSVAPALSDDVDRAREACARSPEGRRQDQQERGRRAQFGGSSSGGRRPPCAPLHPTQLSAAWPIPAGESGADFETGCFWSYWSNEQSEWS